MKKLSMYLLATFMVLVAGIIAVNAQNQTVIAGSDYDYTYARTVSTSTVSWVITGGAGGGAGVDYTITGANTATPNIVWLVASATNYAVTVTETNGGICSATTNYAVSVVAKGNIQFTAPTSNGCPTASAVPIGLTITGNIDYPVVMNISVGGTAGVDVTFADAAAVAAYSVASIGVNATATDIPTTLTINSITGHGSDIMGTTVSHIYTAFAQPSSSTIAHD